MDTSQLSFNPLTKLCYGKTRSVSQLWLVATDTTGAYYLGYSFMAPNVWSKEPITGRLEKFSQLPVPEIPLRQSELPAKESLILTIWDWFLQLPLYFDQKDDIMAAIDQVLTLCRSQTSLDQALAVVEEFQQAKRMPIIARTVAGTFSACDILDKSAIMLAEDQFRAVKPDLRANSRTTRTSAAVKSARSSASMTTSPLSHDKPWPENITLKVESAKKRAQSGTWEVSFALRSYSSLLCGEVRQQLKPHENIQELCAKFEHVVLDEPGYLVVYICEPRETGNYPVAVGVANISRLIYLGVATFEIPMYCLHANDADGWGKAFETITQAKTSVKYSKQVRSLKVTMQSTELTTPDSGNSDTSPSFLMDSFNPQNRVILSCNNFVLTTDEPGTLYWIKITATGNVQINGKANSSSRSFAVKNGQSLGQQVELAGDLEEGVVLFTVYVKGTALYTGKNKIKGFQDGSNTVALTSNNSFVGYIKLHARILNSSVSYQPTVDKLLNGGGNVSAISLLSQTTQVQFYRQLFERTLRSFVDSPKSRDSIAALNAMCEIGDRVGYLMSLFFNIEQIPVPKLLGCLLSTYGAFLPECNISVHRNLPRILQWLTPHCTVEVELVTETINSLATFVQSGPNYLSKEVLRNFVDIIISFKPIVGFEKLAEYVEAVVEIVPITSDLDVKRQMFFFYAQLSDTPLLSQGDLWIRLLGWTRTAWSSDDLPSIHALAIFLKNVSLTAGSLVEYTSKLIPLLFSVLANLLEKPAVCIGDKLFDRNMNTKRPESEMRGLLICEFTLVLGLFLRSEQLVSSPSVVDGRFCTNALKTVRSLVEAPAFPKSWVSLYVLQVRIAVRCIRYLRPLLPSIKPEKCDRQDLELHSKFLTLSARIFGLRLIKPALLFPAERVAVSGIVADTFEQCLDEFCKVWKELGSHDTDECATGGQILVVNSTPTLIQELMRALLQDSNPDTRQKLSTVLHSVIISGYHGTDEEEARRFLAMFLNCLDGVLSVLAKVELPTPEDVLNFIDALNVPDAIFLTKLETFMNLSIGYYLYENLFTAGSVLRFCGDLKLMRLFELYCTRICSIFRENFRVHGLVYVELAKLYQWNDFSVVNAMEFPRLPQQRASGRKRKLMLMAIDCFTKAKEYAMAISITKELCRPAEAIKDYRSLSELSDKLHVLYGKAEATPELVTHYYLVTFPAHRLPLFSKKLYILEGGGLRIDEVRNALQSEYGIPCVIRDSIDRNKDFIFVETVSPYYDELREAGGTVDTFFKTRPLPGSTSVLDLQVEETIFKCAQGFLLISGMSQVENIKMRVLSPVETALQAVQDKVWQFKVLLNKAVERPPGFEIQLEMALSGVITAPVNGGVALYEVFFTDPEMRLACEELGKLVKLAIEIYATAISEKRKPQVDLFWSAFHKNFHSVVI
ncbi:hypothetical protein B9G98_03511 [Wickerhamiella sorbophila]|uniref:DOCKER domain-containing protein n=1 Tax=Wickerhamiella sorbophila TaxID=45607 RepID=A0A2T0FLM0_9ASCO|nr:hypothetical protein B9G98_03511 [Wickerhamiella sorbophila]PRT55891.1 hypothetical protein B9G98_03511 [Wickerhamiella sorbophila]